MAVITISRTYGAGGRQLGLRLARTLGYDYFDKEILHRLSDRLGQDEGRLALFEQEGYGPSDALLSVIGRKYPAAEADFPSSAGYAGAVVEILKELASRNRVVIVGRGGQAVLTDDPLALHLRLVSGEKHLLSRLAARPAFAGLGESEIRRRLRRENEARSKYVRKHFDIDWNDPLHYHIVLNVERLSSEEAEAAVIAAVRKRDEARD